jgi:hypothetical protein
VNEVPIVSLSGLPAVGMLWEAQPGQRSLTVIVKATFALVPGEIVLARGQDPLGEDRPWDGNVLSSLYAPSDFAPSKKRADVTLAGHAYAPGGRPVTSLVARLVVGELDKAVQVTGDRAWTGSADAPEPSAPAPFARMPLRYERAALSADNPVGVDHRAPPNLERVAGGSGSPCFGPVSPTWRARRRLLDEASTFWAYGVARDPRLGGPPPGPLPPRFDFAFFNTAPPDQQLDLLRPGTPLELENLHPIHARLSTSLPKLKPQVFAMPAPGSEKTRVEEIIVRCDALWIDTDRAVAVLTWRGLTDVEPDARVGNVVVAADASGKKLRWAQVEKWLGETTSPTMRLGPDGLPLEIVDEVTVPADVLGQRHDALKGGPRDIDDDLTRPVADKRTPPPRSGLRATPEPAPILASAARAGAAAPAIPPTVEPDEIDPPTVGAPLAPASPAALRVPRPGGSDAPPHARRPTMTLRKDLTLERCAEIAAALAQKGADRGAVLRARMLTEASWAVVEKQWQRVIAAEAGERTTADAFDDAVVAAQERWPRPIDMAAYARLTVGVERGEVGRLLGELDLELSDLVRLHRVWERRTAASLAVSERLARAIDDARRAQG